MHTTIKAKAAGMMPPALYVTAIVLAAIASIAPPTAATAQPVLDLDDSTWTFVDALAKTKARAQGVGKTKVVGLESIELRLLPGNAWEADAGVTLLSGTYEHTSATKTRLALTLDAPSLAALADRYEAEVEAAAALEGLSITTTLTVVGAKVIAIVKAQGSTGTATTKLKAKFVFAGTVSAPLLGVSGVPGEVAAKLKGTSAPVPLADTAGETTAP
jgi:hypothetical protein